MYRDAPPLSLSERSTALLLSLGIPASVMLTALMIHDVRPTPTHRETLVSISVVRPRTAENPDAAKRPSPAKSPAARPSARNLHAASRPPAIKHERPRELAALQPSPPAILNLPPPSLTIAEQPLNPPGGGEDGGGKPAIPEVKPVQPSRKSGSRQSLSDNYGREVYRRIRAEQRYETTLQRANLAGTVVVAFTVDRLGELRRPEIALSSGHIEMDRIALSHLSAASPFPRPPRGKSRNFKIPLTYRQRD